MLRLADVLDGGGEDAAPPPAVGPGRPCVAVVPPMPPVASSPAKSCRTPPLKRLYRLGFVAMEAVNTFQSLVSRQASPREWRLISAGPF